MGVGRGIRGSQAPLDFEFFSSKSCFPSFEWENQISPLLAHPWKNLGKIPKCTPLKKILPTPMHMGIMGI